MIKTLAQYMFGADTVMIYCDNCGEGLSLQSDCTEVVQLFCNVHIDCTKPINNNLEFLQIAEPYA